MAEREGNNGDELLFGWDPLPGIVSVWADRAGHAWVWRREHGSLLCSRESFRPWLFASSLDDLSQSRVIPQLASSDAVSRARITFTELQGIGDGYRYLLTAPTWGMLESALLDGASRRLGQRITSLYDLSDRYYCVGPVEQYLMATGRVYFRDLTYQDIHRLQFDLETTALDAQRGRIFLVAIRDSRGLATTLEAPTAADEPRLIADLCALIRARDPDIIENHNLFGFDLPFLIQRAERLSVPLPLGRGANPRMMERYGGWGFGSGSRHRHTRYSVPGREFIDTLDAVRRYDFAARDLPSYRLKEVAQHFGVAAGERVYLPGAEVFATYKTEPDRVRKYALDDVSEVDALSQRLLSACFALAGMAPRRFERLASAGPAMGILEPMLVRAYLRAGAELPRQANSGEDLPPHAGGGLHLFAAGVAERVVKTDVASLYPSLMRAYRIGPACDRLQVLLQLVDRLTDLRLAHKDAARSAPNGSLEAGSHQAAQAAMKTLINSAYGYMGAGSMALFADRSAADEVTRRGRNVLMQVIEALRAGGVALIEADTDGVYFAVPAGWTEVNERALVQRVGSELPPGIRLEYEGRYRAMFSHEVKNYALLTYGGELIVRGVALRSSRSEPFGERFLRQALQCTLMGDVSGLRSAFIETVDALRRRALPTSEIAARQRLSKTPEAYLVRRSVHREAHYEALILAGRTQWTVGERVRCYRVRGGTLVWLPDETEDVGIGDGWETIEEQDDDDPRAPDNALSLSMSAPSVLRTALDERRDYDIDHYLQVLITSYAGRLAKAFSPEDFERLFRLDDQAGLFDPPLEEIQPRWIRCLMPEQPS